MGYLRLAAAALLGLTCLARPVLAQTSVDAGITALLAQLEDVLRSGDVASYSNLLSAGAKPELAQNFADAALDSGVTRAVVRERDRVPFRTTPDAISYRLIVDLFTERGTKGKIGTWRLDVERRGAGEWRILDQESLTTVDGLYRLGLVPSRQFQVNNLTVIGEDLTIKLVSGTAFVAEADNRPAVLVIRGRGEMIFEPAPAAERTQLKIFAGAEVLRADFDAAFIRLNPADFESRVSSDALVPVPVNARELARATEVFDQYIAKSFALDLSDLSREIWSLMPGVGDLLAEIRTRRFKTLTYARSLNEPEDVTLFDREHKRNIALYSSEAKLAAHGRFYGEDDNVEYDVLNHDIDTNFDPEREWLEGRTVLKIRVRSLALATFTLKLAENLAVRSIVSDRFGPLLGLRVSGQDNILINLPSVLPKDSLLTLVLLYGGRLPFQKPEREAMGVQSQDIDPLMTVEPRYLYSSRSYWYPQSTVSDYGTATLRLTVPSEFAIVASGDPSADSPQLVPLTPEAPELRRYTFVASQPVRYLSCLISRFTRHRVSPVMLSVPAPEPEADDRAGGPQTTTPLRTGVSYGTLDLAVEANPRQQTRVPRFSARATQILRYFTTIVADFPYESFTLALVEDATPGGHSPAYFALLNQPLPATPFLWRNDPVNFDGYPDFFLAHELAHQWWGQAVGWKNYHEQWLSEGIAQYFAALFAREDGGQDLFDDIMEQMRRSAISNSPQGPVYLGYRLGHLQSNGRIFRALVYNKGAAVLHMMRGLIGEEAFFAGLRRFYDESRFKKVGTEQLRAAFEAESGRSLEQFFEQWIDQAGIPTIAFSHRVETAMEPTSAGSPATHAAFSASASAQGVGVAGQQVILRFEQRGDVYELPVTVSLISSTGVETRVLITVTEKITEMKVPFSGRLRDVKVNSDNAALAEFRQ